MIRQEMNYAQISTQLRNPGGGVMRELLRKAHRVEVAAKRLAPMGATGDLKGSIQVFGPVVMANGSYGYQVGTDVHYGQWVVEGTGIYGPYGVPIVPTTQPVMRFYWRKAGKYVVTPSVRGQPGQDFLRKALPAAYGG